MLRFLGSDDLGGPIQADNFRLKSLFPENRSNYQYARYLFYVGQINVVQLDYSTAFANLSQVRCIRTSRMELPLCTFIML